MEQKRGGEKVIKMGSTLGQGMGALERGGGGGLETPPELCRLGYTTKTNCKTFQSVHPDTCSIFYKKGLRLASPPYFAYDFSGKIFLTLHSINFIVWWPLLLEILDNMWVIILCYPVCKVNLSFIIYPSFYMIRKVRKKLKYLKNEKSF